jgi:hypothetical protein
VVEEGGKQGGDLAGAQVAGEQHDAGALVLIRIT